LTPPDARVILRLMVGSNGPTAWRCEQNMRHGSTHWLEEELSQTSEQLKRLLTLERAAAERHSVENTPETEAAYERRRAEADRLRDWQAQLVKELNRRAAEVSPKKAR
jgi:hypothetical protein